MDYQQTNDLNDYLQYLQTYSPNHSSELLNLVNPTLSSTQISTEGNKFTPGYKDIPSVLNFDSPIISNKPIEAPFTSTYDTPTTTQTPKVTNSGERINISKGETGTAKRAVDYLVKSGLSKKIALAITANGLVESGLNTAVIGDTKLGKGQEAVGIAQWRLNRKNNMLNFLKNKGLPASSFEGQLSFLVHELQTGQDGSNGEAWRQMQSSNDVGELAKLFDKHYERSDGRAREKRAALARQLEKTI